MHRLSVEKSKFNIGPCTKNKYTIIKTKSHAFKFYQKIILVTKVMLNNTVQKARCK